MRALYLDCFAGISGDMFLGAMLDLGVSFEHLKEKLSLLGLDHEFQIIHKKADKHGIFGTKLDVIEKHSHESLDPHHEDHHHHDHAHLRDYEAIKSIIINSALSESTKALAISIFDQVAVAEAHVHNRPVDHVHFHEVGAIDSIVDIVGAAICFEMLDVDHVIASPIEVGSGFVRCAHGYMPVPAPATAEILKGVPIVSRVDGFEMTTPTGAAIVKTFSKEFSKSLNFEIEKIGYGLGARDLEIPNLLRAMLVSIPDKKKTKRFSGL